MTHRSANCLGETYLGTILEVYVNAHLPYFYEGQERFYHFYPFSSNIREEASEHALASEHKIPTFISNRPFLHSSTTQP